jgi:Flp pilus assembly protein TadD
MSNKEKAVSLKQQGNDAYKKKDFSKAVEHFKAAIELDPTEITFYTNLAAVHFETKVLLYLHYRRHIGTRA